jgi:hypothetical protein
MSDVPAFLSRWSRRKIAARRVRPAAAPGGECETAAGRSPADDAADRPALPDPATLDIESDFAAFMAPDIPDTLRKEALRRLWRLDPGFSKLDGMNEYDEDFTGGGVARIVRTAYRVGRGIVGDAGDAEPAEAGSDPEPHFQIGRPEPGRP